MAPIRRFLQKGAARTHGLAGAACGTFLFVSALGCGSPYPVCSAATAPKVAVAEGPKINYVLVEQSALVEQGEAPVVEVRGTEAYSQERPHLTTAAIRFPENCVTESVGQESGHDNNAAVKLQTKCGVYLKEIENALAMQGFRVFSWDALYQLQNTKKMSTYDAARELGADVVFVFNTLEAGEIKAGDTKKVRTRYLRSDADGNAGERLELSENDRSQFKDFARNHSNATSPAFKEAVLALSATLDATAVIIKRTTTAAATGATAGEAIWFFRYTKTKLQTETAGQRFLFASLNGGPYAPTYPRTSQSPEGAQSQGNNKLSSEDEETSHEKASAVDRYQAEHLVLIRGSAEEFVKRFKEGK